ncbi:MAG: carboxypeptidase-like regulatory domain-containing protein [Chloroflexota bacterium]
MTRGLIRWLSIIAMGINFQIAQAQEIDLYVHIASPGEGETVYAGPTSVLYSIPISGWVNHFGLDYDEITLRLDIYQNDELIGTQTEELNHNSTFDFYVTVNPEATGWMFDPMQASCIAYCHTPSILSLPRGEVLLRVTATGPDGQFAFDERHIVVDRSGYATVPVNVVLADNPDHKVAGITVRASTWLYMWRARAAIASTDDQGNATVTVEALAEAPTTYVFRVDPVIVDGVIYESIDTVEVTLPPGATTTSPITLTVTSKVGEISGVLLFDKALLYEPVTITALRLSDGTTYKLDTSEGGTFTYPGLLVDKYLIAVDNSKLLSKGLYVATQEVDLTKNHQVFLEMPVHTISGGMIKGRVLDEHGSPLPFAWITLENTNATQSTQPDNGLFLFHDLPSSKTVVLQLRAPGYYSQEKPVTLSDGSISDIEIHLLPQQGTRYVPWGNGQVILPAESQVETSKHALSIERGWLWGYGDSDLPLVIQTGSAEIILTNAQFALETLPNRSEWLFVFEGEAEVRIRNTLEVITIQANQMVNLLNNRVPYSMPYDPLVLSVFRSMDVPPLAFTWESSLKTRIRDLFSNIVVTTAQVVIYSTYIVLLAVILAVPFLIFWRTKRERLS